MTVLIQQNRMGELIHEGRQYAYSVGGCSGRGSLVILTKMPSSNVDRFRRGFDGPSKVKYTSTPALSSLEQISWTLGGSGEFSLDNPHECFSADFIRTLISDKNPGLLNYAENILVPMSSRDGQDIRFYSINHLGFKDLWRISNYQLKFTGTTLEGYFKDIEQELKL